MPNLSEKIPCRDPFILCYDGKYYLYKSDYRSHVICLVSEDLEHFADPVPVLTAPENFHGTADFFWAPECHYFNGNFYIFTSVRSNLTGHRSISVYRAASPLGPFVDIAGGYISPKDWDAIDGTLYVDPAGQPWMVFVHEWTSMPDHNGSMVAAKLSNDLTHFISEPQTLFYAREPAWATAGVTDGPFLHSMSDGSLCMIWSNFGKSGYVVAMATSESGNILGPWKHADRLLYEKGLQPAFTTDGGHAMLFTDRNGDLRLSLHGPNHKNETDFEHLQLFRVAEDGDLLKIIG